MSDLPEWSDEVRVQLAALGNAFADLVDELADAAQKMDHDKDKMAAVIKAAGAVARFVQGDSHAFAAGAHRPLVALVNELHDLRAGAPPSLFTSKGKVENRPAETTSNLVRGQAAAVAMILEDAGEQPGGAAVFVAAEMKRHGITQPNGKLITAHLVRRWRDNVKQQRSGRLMTQAAHAVIKREAERQQRHKCEERGNPEAIEQAERRAAIYIASLAQQFWGSRKGQMLAGRAAP